AAGTGTATLNGKRPRVRHLWVPHTLHHCRSWCPAQCPRPRSARTTADIVRPLQGGLPGGRNNWLGVGMNAKHDAAKTSTQVEHVRAALLRNYAGLIYDDDLLGYDEVGREQRFLSRALSAEALRIVTGCDREAAGQGVTDGARDQGIDAVAVGEGS